MSTEVYVALVAAGASLLVALTSLISARENTRRIVESTREIEQLKFELLRKNANLLLSDKELESSLDALRQLIGNIQRVKDAIQLVLHSLTEAGADHEQILGLVQTARAFMFSGYEEQLPSMNREEADIAHKAKNLSLLVEQSSRMLLENPSIGEHDIEQGKNSLLEMRILLTDYQNLLRDSRLTRLTKIDQQTLSGELL